MLIYNDIYTWEGWGGTLQLGSGECRLRIFDLRQDESMDVKMIKPFVVIVSDTHAPSPKRLSVKSCASHVASRVVKDFGIDPNRMVWVEYYPTGGHGGTERFDEAEFKWEGGDALSPDWRDLSPFYKKIVRRLLEMAPDDIDDIYA